MTRVPVTAKDQSSMVGRLAMVSDMNVTVWKQCRCVQQGDHKPSLASVCNCTNGGWCSGHACVCPSAYTGKFCEKPQCIVPCGRNKHPANNCSCGEWGGDGESCGEWGGDGESYGEWGGDGESYGEWGGDGRVVVSGEEWVSCGEGWGELW